MRPSHSADDVESIFDISDPIAHRLIERIFKCFGAALYWHNSGAQELHAIYISGLTFNVLRAHVHHTFHAVTCRHGSRRYAVLPRAGLGDDTRLTHAFSQQRLSYGVIHLMRAGMIKILTLQINLRAIQPF